MKACHHTRLTQQGLTLIELLIAMMLSAFLLAGVIQTFTSARQTYRVEEGLSRLIENGRYAIEFIDRDVRMAGYRGCNGSISLAAPSNHLTNPTAFINNFDTPLEGFNWDDASSSWAPAMDTAITSPADGEDVITVRRAEETGFSVTAHAAATDPITLASTGNLEAPDTVLIADCNHAEVFAIDSITGNNVTPAATLTNSYHPPANAELYPINTTSYYVRCPDPTDHPCVPDGSNIPSLYRRIGTKDAQELIEGVQKLQIEYGEDTDLVPDYTANYYVPANSVVDMKRVVSVRIRLLVATPDDHVTAEKQTYSFAGTDYDATDNRIRHEFTSTIALRNRIK